MGRFLGVILRFSPFLAKSGLAYAAAIPWGALLYGKPPKVFSFCYKSKMACPKPLGWFPVRSRNTFNPPASRPLSENNLFIDTEPPLFGDASPSKPLLSPRSFRRVGHFCIKSLYSSILTISKLWKGNLPQCFKQTS